MSYIGKMVSFNYFGRTRTGQVIWQEGSHLKIRYGRKWQVSATTKTVTLRSK